MYDDCSNTKCYQFTDYLQACLKAIYITWVSYDTKLHPPLEPLIVDLLTNMHLPEINCLPVKKPFGSLKELILYPIFEDSSLPYTNDAAIKLLRSVGKFMIRGSFSRGKGGGFNNDAS